MARVTRWVWGERRISRHLPGGISVIAALVLLAGAFPQVGHAASPLPVWDDFRAGFSVGPVGSGSKWFYFGTPDGSFVGDDGIATTRAGALAVAARGINPATHLPAFTKTVAQEQVSGLPGGLDHVKWLVYMNHLSSASFPGFDAQPGQQLVCQTTLSGRTFGTEGHPFGAAVTTPTDDLRLASLAMNVIDFETYMVFDIFYTDTRIYAFYERLPFGRASLGGPYGEYAAFSYAIPIGTRTPGDVHTVAVAYDKSAGTVRWYVDDQLKHTESTLGRRIDRQYMLLDHGGTEEAVTPRQLDCGMGLFTLMDGHGPQNKGLAALSSTPGFYYNPTVGAPTLETFVDPQSQAQSRIFGQGAALGVTRPSVGYVPSP